MTGEEVAGKKTVLIATGKHNVVLRARARRAHRAVRPSGTSTRPAATCAIRVRSQSALSYVVRARMREIGVRPALGATPSVMLSNTLLRGVTPAIAGVDSSVSASRRHGVFRALLFDVQPP